MRTLTEWARAEKIERLWAVLDSPLTVEIAAALARSLRLPLVTTVWDDILHNIRYFGLDRWLRRFQQSRFSEAMKRSVRCAVIGEAMAKEYQSRYGVESVIVRHGVAGSLWLDPLPGPADILRIGFAGSVTAASAFEALLSALDGMAWTIDGRRVQVRLLGARFDIRSKVPRNLECLGWRSLQNTIELLSECHLTYLPQPFESEWGPFARWSFPTKLTTCLAAGVPILIHAPAYASLPPFVEERKFGAACSSLDGDQIISSIRGLISGAAYARARKQVRAVRESEFSRENFRRQFAEFLGVDARSLRA